MPLADHAPGQHREFLADWTAAGAPLVAAHAFTIVLLGEILTVLSRIPNQIGALTMSTQQDAANLAQQIAAENTAWQNWATQIETAFTNVVNALTAAQQNNVGVDLTDAVNAANAGQQLITALPTVTDPTQPAPAPSTGA